MRLLVIIAAIITLLSAQPAAASDEMGTERAGKYFTKIVCPAAAAGDHFDKAVFHGRNTISLNEVKRRFSELQGLSTQYGKAVSRFTRQAFNPPAPWPASVARLMDRYASLAVRLGDDLLRAGEARTVAAFVRLIRQAADVPFGHLGAQIRSRLDLPPTC